jgi:hypothetical protein
MEVRKIGSRIRRTHFGAAIRSGKRIEVSSLKELGTRYLRTKFRLGYRLVKFGGGPEIRFENLKHSFLARKLGLGREAGDTARERERERLLRSSTYRFVCRQNLLLPSTSISPRKLCCYLGWWCVCV